MTLLEALRLVDGHDGKLSLPAVTLYFGFLGLMLGGGVVALGVVAVATLALEHKRRVNHAFAPVHRTLAALEARVEGAKAKTDALEPKVQQLLNRAAFDKR